MNCVVLFGDTLQMFQSWSRWFLVWESTVFLLLIPNSLEKDIWELKCFFSSHMFPSTWVTGCWFNDKKALLPFKLNPQCVRWFLQIFARKDLAPPMGLPILDVQSPFGCCWNQIQVGLHSTFSFSPHCHVGFLFFLLHPAASTSAFASRRLHLNNNITTSSTHHHQHITNNTTPSTQHHQHNTIHTTPSAHHHQQHTIITTPSTQHQQHNTITTTRHQQHTINTTPSTNHHQQHTINTTPSTQHHINTTTNTTPSTTTPSTHHQQHNTINTSPSTQHHQHNTINTTPSTQHHQHKHRQHNILNTSPSTQRHPHNTIHTTSPTHHHQHNTINPPQAPFAWQARGRRSTCSTSVSFCMAEVRRQVSTWTPAAFAWQVQHSEDLHRGRRKSGDKWVLWRRLLLRGRCSTWSTSDSFCGSGQVSTMDAGCFCMAGTALGAPQAPFCVAGAALGAPECHFAWQAQHVEHLHRVQQKSGDKGILWTPAACAWQVQHLEHLRIIFRGRCSTLDHLHRGRRKSGDKWVLWTPAAFAWQVQRLEHLRLVLRGKCSIWSTFIELRGSLATSEYYGRRLLSRGRCNT